MKGGGAVGKQNSAVVPVERLELDDYDWYERHADVLACQAAVDHQIVMIGDSITHLFGAKPPQAVPEGYARGQRAFNSLFKGRRVLNLGFGWDRSQNVLWRLDHGELDERISPSLVVVNIGTNNTMATENARENTAPEISAGIAAVCARVRAKVPASCRIVLMKIFPREELPSHPRRVLIDSVNALLPALAQQEGYTLLDVAPAMLQSDGTLPQSLVPDFTHPNEAGYKLWADVLRPFVASIPIDGEVEAKKEDKEEEEERDANEKRTLGEAPEGNPVEPKRTKRHHSAASGKTMHQY
jgi:lysophospholipase L1-like esterase